MEVAAQRIMDKIAALEGEKAKLASGSARAPAPARASAPAPSPAAAQLAKLEQAVKVAGLKAQRARKAKPMPPETRS